jgi:hypothetical protein
VNRITRPFLCARAVCNWNHGRTFFGAADGAKIQHKNPLVLPNKTSNSRLKRLLKRQHGASINEVLGISIESWCRWKFKAVGGSHTEQGNGLATLHYTSGNNLDAQGNYAPGNAGFNLADVSSVEELNALPDGVMGMVWLDQYSGVNQSFINAVTPFIGNPKVYGFFLVDEPDPTGQWGTQASAADLKAESDWIHSHVPGAKTFITMMNMGSTDDPSFANTYNWNNTHIDLFGLDPYPVRSNGTLDFDVIDKHVAAAQAAGISLDQIVPVYQTFGGGGWATDTGGSYVMPSAAQMQEMLDRWDALVPNAAFDYAYAWGSQNGDTALESSQSLKNVFLQHNTSEDTGGSTPPVDHTTTPPVVDEGGNTPPVDDTDAPPVVDAGGSTPPVDTGGSTPPVVEAGGSTPPTGGTSGGTTTGPMIDPTPVTDDGGSWHRGGGVFGHGLDFSQLLGRGGHSWAGSSQPDDGGGFSWSGLGAIGGRGGFSWNGSFGGHHDASATTEASVGTEADSGSRFHFAQSALLDAIGRTGMNHDHQWHW